MSGTWHYGLIARWWAEVNRPEREELDYLRGAIRRFGEPALDLGCGTGRLLLPLLADGFDVDGTDVSADMLAHAAAAMGAADARATGRLAQQAFDELAMPRRYGTIFSIGSLAIGGSRDRDQAALRRVRAHLLPGGAAIISYEVASDERVARMADPRIPYPRPWPETASSATLSDGTELELSTRAVGYEAASRTQVLEIRARQRDRGELVREEFGTLRNTYYRPDDLVAMLRSAGFTDVAVEGPYTGAPPHPADDTVVIVAR
jgi:SAM-dependent methyltransferase